MAVPQVMLLGSQAVDKHGLMCRIAGRPLAENAVSAPWTIDNKYYTAEVLLQIAHLAAGEDQQTAVIGAASHEAVLLVFDATKHDTFTSLQKWWEIQQPDPAVRLAVATWAAEADVLGQQQWLFDAQEWCAEQFIEYVEVSEQPDREQRQQQTQEGCNVNSEGEAEVEGVQRIVEALHAHTWPGLQLKPRGTNGALAAAVPAQDGGTALQPAALAEQPLQQNGGAGLGGGLLLGGGLALPEEQGDELDTLFAELAGARDQLQQLGDNERREAAASLMLRLLGALGLEDDDDASEEEEEGQDEGPAMGSSADVLAAEQ